MRTERARGRRHTVRVALLVTCACLGCGDRAGERESDARPRPTYPPPERILLVSIDTLRGDRLSCAGNPRGLTPHLDALARRGALFRDTMTTAPWTLPAHASLLTGLLPAMHRLQEDSARLPEDVLLLAEVLADRDYATIAVVSHDYVSSTFGFDRGFDVFDDTLIHGFRGNPTAAEVVDRFLEHLDSSGAARFSAFLHFFDPHWDYSPPPAFRRTTTDPDYAGPIDGLYATIQRFRRGPMAEEDLRHLVGLYDAEVRYLDFEIGRLFRELSARGLGDGMLLCVVADHGEEFKEHGDLGHGRTVFQEQLVIPVLLAGHPAFAGGTLRSDPVSLIDLAPTLSELAGAPTDLFPGRSLSVPIQGDRLRVAETFQFGYQARAARLGSLKWIHAPKAEAGFDLEVDPRERSPLGRDPTGGRLTSALSEYAAVADQGWHVRLTSEINEPLVCHGSVRTEGRIAWTEKYFSEILRFPGRPKTAAEFQTFEVSEDGRELRFDVVVTASRGEIVFRTEPPDAAVTFELVVASETEEAGIYLGVDGRLESGTPLTLHPADSRAHGLPRGHPPTPRGIHLRAVTPPPAATLSDDAIERLRALGYVE